MDLARDPLGLSQEAMRDIGYRTIDLLVDQLTSASPALRRGEGADLRRRLLRAAPEQPRDWSEALGQLERDVLAPMSRLAHPGYFAFIPASSTFAGALGDLIAAALDIDAGSWMAAAGPTQLELVVLDWFKEWIGYPPDAGGILVSGGSAANMTALACARETLVGAGSEHAVAYMSDQTHSSVAKAARLVGLRPDQLRILPSDGAFRLRLDALAGAIDADLQAGLQPLIVIANAGATNTGAIDPLHALADVCHEHGLWLHVDGAYGAFAALTDEGRRQLDGLARADSVTLDPHKWLYQPIECGSVLVREGRLLREAFSIKPDYLVDYASGEVDFADLGLQLTRSARALKIWLSINYFGLTAFREAIARAMVLTREAERRVRELPELELMAPASLGIVCFRRRFDGVGDEEEIAALNAQLARGFEDSGRGLVSSTKLRGRYAIRLCVMNHTSGQEDIEAVLSWFATASPPSRATGATVHEYADPSSDVTGGWAGPEILDAGALRRLGLFAALDDGTLEIVARSAREVLAAPGEPVVARWQGTRQFYVILDGWAEVRGELGELRELGPGEHFGELAALDWGAGFGYARTADVVAATPLRLLVLSQSALMQVLKRAPELEQRLRAAARERLQQM